MYKVDRAKTTWFKNTKNTCFKFRETHINLKKQSFEHDSFFVFWKGNIPGDIDLG